MGHLRPNFFTNKTDVILHLDRIRKKAEEDIEALFLDKENETIRDRFGYNEVLERLLIAEILATLIHEILHVATFEASSEELVSLITKNVQQYWLKSYREETVIQALTDWSLLGYMVRYNALFHPHLT